MSDKITAYKTQFDCPSCDALIMAAAPISNSPRGLKKGALVVCGYCQTICKVGDSNLIKMKKKELKALDAVSKRTLNICINRIRKNPLSDN